MVPATEISALPLSGPARPRDHRVGVLLQPVDALPATITCGAVAERLIEEPDTPGFVILLDGGRFGLIHRAGYLPRILQGYNREIYSRKPITALMERDPLVVDVETSIEEVGLLVTSAKPQALNGGFILTRDGAYAGIGSGVDLLRTLATAAQESLIELRAAQASLVQAETFASLGQLVAGVAHEINTPIGVALTAASLLRKKSAEFRSASETGQLKRSDLARFVETADEAASITLANIERAAELIRSFKQVAVDRTSAERRRFRLATLIEDLRFSLAPTLRKTRLAVEVACDPAIELDSYPGPLTQVLTNLVLNSVTHAYDDGAAGRLALAAERRRHQVELVYDDDGRGIPPEHLGHIFEPFFTTRRGSGGTGLGLHVAHNIVTQVLRGTIACTSEPGRGTRFRMTLPLDLGPGTGGSDAPAQPHRVTPG